jgi:hypothetical protein
MEYEHLGVRLPADLMTWVREQAAAEERSLNSFIVRLIRRVRDAEQA